MALYNKFEEIDEDGNGTIDIFEFCDNLQVIATLVQSLTRAVPGGALRVCGASSVLGSELTLCCVAGKIVRPDRSGDPTACPLLV